MPCTLMLCCSKHFTRHVHFRGATLGNFSCNLWCKQNCKISCEEHLSTLTASWLKGKSTQGQSDVEVWKKPCFKESKGGAVVRALTAQQCDVGLNPGLGVISGLSLFLVLVLTLRVVSLGSLVFLSWQKPTLLFSEHHYFWRVTTFGIC